MVHISIYPVAMSVIPPKFLCVKRASLLRISFQENLSVKLLFKLRPGSKKVPSREREYKHADRTTGTVLLPCMSKMKI